MVSVVEPMDGIGEPQGSSQHLVRTPEVKRVGVKSQALRANTDLKLALWEGVPQFQLNFPAEGDVPHE